MDPKVAKDNGFDPLSNCNGLTFGDGQFVINGESAGIILNDEYDKVGSDTGNEPKQQEKHDVVTVGPAEGIDKEPYHSATSQPGTDKHTHKDDVLRTKRIKALRRLISLRKAQCSQKKRSQQLARKEPLTRCSGCSKLQQLQPGVINAQQIRSSVLTHWLKKNPLREVQYMAGHKYVSSTERYQVNNLDDLQNELQQHHPLK